MKFIDFNKFRETKAVSASRLNDLAYSPLLYKHNLEATDRQPTAAMIFGSAVDCMITEPGEFQNRYYVSKVDAPSETIQKIVKGVFDEVVEENKKFPDEKLLHPFSELGNFNSNIIEHAAYQQYGQSWKPETLVKKVVDGGSEYFKELINSADKEILQKEEFESVVAVVDRLSNNEFIKDYFDGDMYERFWQLPIIFELKDHNDEVVLCKALLDLVVVDHENKAIRVFDIKTTGQSVHSFVSSYMKFGYFRQGSFYFRAATDFFKTMFPEYQVMNTGFIVAEKANLNPPMIYHMSTQDIMTGEYGGITSYGKQVKGYRTLINDLGWHNATDKWDYPREVYVNEGVTVIDNFNTVPMLNEQQQKIELDAMIESISNPNQTDMFETIAKTVKPNNVK